MLPLTFWVPNFSLPSLQVWSSFANLSFRDHIQILVRCHCSGWVCDPIFIIRTCCIVCEITLHIAQEIVKFQMHLWEPQNHCETDRILKTSSIPPMRARVMSICVNACLACWTLHMITFSPQKKGDNLKCLLFSIHCILKCRFWKLIQKLSLAIKKHRFLSQK